MPGPTPAAVRLRAHSRVAHGGCWEWTRSLTSTGYGQIYYNGRPHSAHRVSWMVFRGPIPAGQCVCHSCDNRLCVNPDHLWLGSAADNARDMMTKGRGRGQITSEFARKLSDDDVRQARDRRARGESINSIAASLGISAAHMSRVVAGAMPRWSQKLTDEARDTVLRMRADGKTLDEIASVVGLHPAHLSKVVRRLQERRP